jgi:hypothetical protein
VECVIAKKLSRPFEGSGMNTYEFNPTRKESALKHINKGKTTILLLGKDINKVKIRLKKIMNNVFPCQFSIKGNSTTRKKGAARDMNVSARTTLNCLLGRASTMLASKAPRSRKINGMTRDEYKKIIKYGKA